LSRIPFYVCEEHHEAFFIWHHAIREGRLPANGSTLLHVDEHADLGSPRLHGSLHQLGQDLEAIWRFTFAELSCFEFIVPSLYQGLFGQLYWIQQAIPRVADQVVTVTSAGRNGRTLELRGFDVIPGRLEAPPAALPDGGWARYRHQTLAQPFQASGPVVLDIDLDYFSCEDAVNLVQKLEVTREEYERFTRDRYHFLKVSQGSRITMRPEGDRYYLYLRNYPEPMPTPLRVSEDVILQRLDAFVEYLRGHAVRPELIDIARSRYSGYTPADQWRFIEENLIRKLGALYELDVRGADEVKAALR